jgi:hypothetical protein
MAIRGIAAWSELERVVLSATLTGVAAGVGVCVAFVLTD